MADPEIRVGITAQYSQAVSAIKQVTAEAISRQQQLKTAQKELDTATRMYESALKQIVPTGSTVNQINSAGKSILREYKDAVDQATASLQALKAAQAEEAEAARIAAIQQKRDYEEYIQKGKDLALTNRSVTSSYYAAQGAAGLLEGRIPYRAMERFLASSQAVSNALMVAFPLFGAVALGEILAVSIEKIVKFTQDAELLGRETGTGWLDGAIGQVDGLKEAFEAADKEQQKLARDLDTLKDQADRANIEHIRLTQGPAAADYAQAAGIQKRIDALEQLKTVEQSEAERFGALAASSDELSRVGSQGIIKDRLQQTVALKQYNDALEQEKVLIQEKNNLYIQAQQAQEKADAKTEKPEKRPDLAGLVREGIEEQRRRAEEAQRLDDTLTATFVQNIRLRDEAERRSNEQFEKDQAAYRRRVEEQMRYQQELSRGQEQQAESAAKLREAQIAAAEESGQISKVAADQARAAAEAQLYAEKLATLDAQLKTLTPDTAEYQRVLNQRNQVQTQAQIAQVQNGAKTATDIAAPYVNATNMVNQAWLGMQDKLIFGTRFIGREFANMGVQMLESVAGAFEKMLVRQMEYELRSILAHEAANRTKQASDAQSAALGTALTKRQALEETFIDAKRAAAGAFKGVMTHVPPPVNFILAPVAAGAAFAATMAVGAFEKGGIIPNTGIALVHEGEGVMPKNLTSLLMTVANTSTSNSNASTFNSTANFHGITDRNFRDMARRHSDVVAGAVHKELRSGRRI